MKVWVALLRGINVGKAKRVAMADLRSLLAGLGYEDVKTVLTSGNAAFRATGTEREIAAAVEQAIVDELGLEVGVVVRSSDELAAVVDGNPFTGRGLDPKLLHCLLVDGEVTDPGLDPDEIAPDELAVGDRVLYLHLPNGVMASRIPDAPVPKGTIVTQRTWNTVLKLQAALPLED